jgi:hypothetical protein
MAATFSISCLFAFLMVSLRIIAWPRFTCSAGTVFNISHQKPSRKPMITYSKQIVNTKSPHVRSKWLVRRKEAAAALTVGYVELFHRGLQRAEDGVGEEGPCMSSAG